MSSTFSSWTMSLCKVTSSFVCVCVYVCVREREKEKEREKNTKWEEENVPKERERSPCNCRTASGQPEKLLFLNIACWISWKKKISKRRKWRTRMTSYAPSPIWWNSPIWIKSFCFLKYSAKSLRLLIKEGHRHHCWCSPVSFRSTGLGTCTHTVRPIDVLSTEPRGVLWESVAMVTTLPHHSASLDDEGKGRRGKWVCVYSMSVKLVLLWRLLFSTDRKSVV